MAGWTQERYRGRLLMEAIAEKLGFGALANRLPFQVYPPYLLVGTALLIEYGILDLYNFFVSGKASWLTEPKSIAIPLGVTLAIVGTRYMHDNYARAIADLRIEDRDDGTDPRPLESLISFRTRLILYLVSVAVFELFLYFVMGYDTLIGISGLPVFLVGNFVLFPLVYIPTLVEFMLTYFSIHFALPRRLEQSGVGLFFHDSRNMGGFGSIGQLLKRSYYLYTIALVLYFFQSYAQVIFAEFISSSYPDPGPIIQTSLTIAWIIGVLSIGYSMFRIHQLMVTEKEARTRELEDEIRAAIDDPYNISSAEIVDQDRYERARERLEHVQSTNTYPTTFTMWSQIAISVLLPQALSMAV